ncbi:MAG: lamin tail domain-containing protein [Chitinophagales bacterium]|nr:lamin tail domain-containing protein [Chitinophagales bacterium]MDW8272777.1 lamin tail domain-containing protein [Chitinophagales bacterium]
MKFNWTLLVIVLFVLSACTKDRIDELTKDQNGSQVKIVPGVIVINEILSTGNPDWVEIYNTANQKIFLEAGKWYVSDNLGNQQKFLLPDTAIKANGYLLIPCDGTGTPGQTLNTSFSISSQGEQFGVFYKQGNLITVIDSVSFGAIPSNYSFGRKPNGSGNFIIISSPTPNSSND